MHFIVFYQRYDKMLLRFAGIPVFCHAACCCCSACCARHAIWLPDREGRGLPPPGAGPRGSRGPHPCPGQPSSHPSTNCIPSLLAGPFLVGDPQHWLILGREGSPDVDCSRGQIRPLIQDILKQKRKEQKRKEDLSGVLWDGYILGCCVL